MNINVILNGIREQEMELGLHRRLDYYEIAMTLLYTGTKHQRERINWYMQNYNGNLRTRAIKEFIDVQIELGNIEV